MESAIGLMIGLGNEGTHLSAGPIDTYVSRDAGLTWELAKKGSHIYEYGDHGGLIVMAKNLEDTNEIVFSWNEGDTWHPCHFSNNPVRIYNIMSGAGPSYGSSEQFVGYGKRGTSDILLHFDFSDLHERKCVGSAFPDTPGSDYELWIPGRRTALGECILGRHMGYVRRKPSAQCLNGAFFNRGNIKTLCPCTRDDFTCEYCYEVPDTEIDTPQEMCIFSEACRAYGLDPTAPPENCNGSYTVSSGYRLVVGDECVINPTANAPFLPTTVACPTSTEPGDGDGDGESDGALVPVFWVVGGIVAILAIVAVVAAVIFFVGRLVRNRGFHVIKPTAAFDDNSAL